MSTVCYTFPFFSWLRDLVEVIYELRYGIKYSKVATVLIGSRSSG